MAKVCQQNSLMSSWKVLIKVVPEVLMPCPYMWSGPMHAKSLVQHAALNVSQSLFCHTASAAEILPVQPLNVLTNVHLMFRLKRDHAAACTSRISGMMPECERCFYGAAANLLQ